MSSSKNSPSYPPKPSAIPSSSILSAIHTTLHLIFVRNKNQHGHAKWWKHLSMLRRSLRSLIDAVERFEKYVDSEGIEWHELRMNDKRDKIVDLEGDLVGGDDKVVEQGRYLATWIVPKAYIAFSTVVADTQFSVLGVVLIAALAQLAEAIKEFNPPEEQEVQEADPHVEQIPVDVQKIKDPVQSDKLEDMGEIIVRRPAASTIIPTAPEPKTAASEIDQNISPRERQTSQVSGTLPGTEKPPSEKKKKAKTTKSIKRPIDDDEGATSTKAKSKSKKLSSDTTKLKKKKKTKKNAIDDIFGGL